MQKNVKATQIGMGDAIEFTVHCIREAGPNGIMWDKLIEILTDIGYEESDAKDVIDQALEMGIISEPETGKFKLGSAM